MRWVERLIGGWKKCQRCSVSGTHLTFSTFCYVMLYYSLFPKWIKIFFPHNPDTPHSDNMIVCFVFFPNVLKTKKLRNHNSQPFLDTLLMHLWKQLQPRVFFQCDATSLAHLSLGSFAHYSVLHLSSSLRWNEKHWCSLHRCSVGIQCGFWLGHSLAFIHTVVLKPLLISRLCALKSPSCPPDPVWRLEQVFKFFQDAAEKHPRGLMQSLVLQALAWWWETPGLLQIWRKSIFVSSDRRTLFLMICESFWQTWRQVSVYTGPFYATWEQKELSCASTRTRNNVFRPGRARVC